MFSSVFRLTRHLILIVMLGLLVGCQNQKSLVGTDITGADFPNPLALTDHNGHPRTMADFKGKVVVLFFGFTHCPDVCPTTMLDLKNTMKILGEQADQVQVLFVTVDPERDTQAVLAKFVPSFDARFIGLTGSVEAVADTLKNFKIYSAKVPGKSENDYAIDHSAGMYLFDQQGKARVYLSHGQAPADIASDIQRLL